MRGVEVPEMEVEDEVRWGSDKGSFVRRASSVAVRYNGVTKVRLQRFRKEVVKCASG